MHRASFLILVLLLLTPTVSFGQSGTTDSQTLQALLAEVHQLRQDLQTTAAAVQRAQILLHRLQIQEMAVTRAQQRLQDARSRLGETKSHREKVEANVKYTEKVIEDGNESAAQRKEYEADLPGLKAQLQTLAGEEQQRQAAETEAEEQLRMQQERLDGLEQQLDRLDKALESASRPSDRIPH